MKTDKAVCLAIIIRDKKSGQIQKVEKNPGFNSLPIEIQREFLHESKEDFKKRVKEMEKRGAGLRIKVTK